MHKMYSLSLNHSNAVLNRAEIRSTIEINANSSQSFINVLIYTIFEYKTNETKSVLKTNFNLRITSFSKKKTA